MLLALLLTCVAVLLALLSMWRSKGQEPTLLFWPWCVLRVQIISGHVTVLPSTYATIH